MATLSPLPAPAASPPLAPAHPEPASPGASVAETIRSYLASCPESVLLADGRVLFDLRTAQCSLTGEGRFCTLHLWSEAGSTVRRIAGVTLRGEVLRLEAVRLGQRRGGTLELAPARGVRSRAPRETGRRRSVAVLERVLTHAFPDWRVAGLRTAMDLERSFGPAYLRGSLVRGRDAWAVVAVGAGESQTTVDGVLSVALLWLQHCREGGDARLHYSGLRVIVPRGMEAVTAARMRWLDPRVARFELCTLDGRSEELAPVDPRDHGNGVTRLLEAPGEDAGRRRFAASIERVLDLLPHGCTVAGLLSRGTDAEQGPVGDASPMNAKPGLRVAPAHRLHGPARETHRPVCEVALRSSAEVVFLCHGLAFARIRAGFAQGSFRREDEITVGHRTAEVALTPANAAELRALVAELFARRQPSAADRTDPLFRTAPERWLESVLRRSLPALDPALLPAPVYTQVPAFTGAGASLDRGMLDLLAVTRESRLAVIEVKAEEDLHLAMQGLDYWIRVREHHLGDVDPATGLGSLQRHGYFAATRLAAESPHLYLVAPALRIHSATETILRCFAPEISWRLIALDERWRQRVAPVWIKRSTER